MKTQRKRRLIVFSAVAVVAMLLLAAGLSGLKLQRGRSLEFWLSLLLGDMDQIDYVDYAPVSGEKLVSFVRILMAGILVLLPLAIIAFILYPDVRKRVLREFLRVLAFVAIFYLVSQMGILEGMQEFPETMEEVLSPEPVGEAPAGFSEESVPEFMASSPSWFVWAASFVLALVVVALLLWVGWSFMRRFSQKQEPMAEIAQEAQSALDALQSGADFRNTIIRCYHEMGEALKVERGIQRGYAMTPREFERRLTDRGLPVAPVNQLTRLFEAVRYGTLAPGEQEEDQAIASLRAIVAASKHMT